jgi:pimeloyl-ACP methyl ester carboxylesterase
LDAVSQLKGQFHGRQFHAAVLSTITARTLIVHGDRDPLYPTHIPCEIFHAIPQSRLWIVPDAGHGMIFQKQAPHFVELALAFLGEGTGGKPIGSNSMCR